MSSVPESWRSPGEGNGFPFQYSCLENPMDRGAWWTTVYGVAKSWTQLNTHTPLTQGKKGEITNIQGTLFISPFPWDPSGALLLEQKRQGHKRWYGEDWPLHSSLVQSFLLPQGGLYSLPHCPLGAGGGGMVLLCKMCVMCVVCVCLPMQNVHKTFGPKDIWSTPKGLETVSYPKYPWAYLVHAQRRFFF